MMKKFIIATLIVLVAFFAYYFSKYFFGYFIFGPAEWNDLSFNVKSSIILSTGIFFALAATWLIAGKPSFSMLGIRGNSFRGLLIGFACTIPMWLGYGIHGTVSDTFSPDVIYRDMILAGFGEEFIFRGFLFGLLFYRAGWGFIPANLAAGLFFGAGHLYQAEDASSAIMIFAFTVLASTGFAWFYVAFNSLWMVIFLHGFMDLAWDMFSGSGNVLGNSQSNLYRFIALGLAITASIIYIRRNADFSMKGKWWLNLKQN